MRIEHTSKKQSADQMKLIFFYFLAYRKLTRRAIFYPSHKNKNNKRGTYMI